MQSDSPGGRPAVTAAVQVMIGVRSFLAVPAQGRPHCSTRGPKNSLETVATGKRSSPVDGQGYRSAPGRGFKKWFRWKIARGDAVMVVRGAGADDGQGRDGIAGVVHGCGALPQENDGTESSLFFALAIDLSHFQVLRHFLEARQLAGVVFQS